MKVDQKNSKTNENQTQSKRFRLSFIIVIAIILACLLGLAYRIIYLDTVNQDFLQTQAKSQIIHKVKVSATRGVIFDRNGVPLAVSTTLYKLILDVKVLSEYPDKYPKLASLNIDGLSIQYLHELIQKYPHSRYRISSQYITPLDAQHIKDLHIPGIYLEKQMRTYYPEGSATAQLIGFTNASNKGQDGLEMTYNNQLKAHSSTETIETDSRGNLIKTIHAPIHYHQGKDIYLSIDAVIQQITFNALKAGVIDAQADSGAAIVLNSKTGEVLASASYPSFNPNLFSSRSGRNIAERSIIDTFEPGSTFKPFIMALGLESGKYTPNMIINTSPGYFKIGKNIIRDESDSGAITVTQVLEESSNVGISKIALSLPHDKVFDFLHKLGFGNQIGYEFPGENNGYLPVASSLGEFSYATVAFGYGLTSSVLQLAHAYSIFANNGKLCPVSLTHKKHSPLCPQVISPKYANEVLQMLNSVVSNYGTAPLANIPGFKVAGKTGTSHKVANGRFLKNSYNAIFAGIAPLKDPRVVIVVWIDNPQKSHIYSAGGISAAPVFSSIARKSLAYMREPYHEGLQNYELINKSGKWNWIMYHFMGWNKDGTSRNMG